MTEKPEYTGTVRRYSPTGDSLQLVVVDPVRWGRSKIQANIISAAGDWVWIPSAQVVLLRPWRDPNQ